VTDYNELDDTSKNPLLRNAGSDENAAFERVLLKEELNDDYGLSSEDFEFAEDYFQEQTDEREFLHERHWPRYRPASGCVWSRPSLVRKR